MRASDSRFDFLLGVNSTHSPDVLDVREVRSAKNARLTQFGALLKRAGTQRMHATKLGGASAFSNGFSSGFGTSASTVTGVFQWDNPSQTAQIIAICNGNLYHKALADANFTTVASTLSTTQLVSFAPYKQSGTNRLYFADGTLRKWTATTLTTSISGAPSGAKFLAVYKERMFASAGTQVIYWSKVGDAETWAAPDGGQANVETYDSEPIVGLATVGSSLLIFKQDSIARFTGTQTSTIDIDKGSEGISPDVGCVAAGSIVKADDFVFFLSERGPYIANESGVQPIGKSIEAELSNWVAADLDDAWAVHNKQRREIWLFVPTDSITGNNIAWCWNIRTQSWTGPWTYDNYHVTCAATVEDANSVETCILGGDDGYVRNGDVDTYGAMDDVLSDGTGGTAIEMEVEFPPFLFGDPGAVKILHSTNYLQANLGSNGQVVATGSGDERTSDSTYTITRKGSNAVLSYKFYLAWRGRRPILKLKDSTSEISSINGVQLEAVVGRRVA